MLMSCGNRTAQVEELTLKAGESWKAPGTYRNFIVKGEGLTEQDAEAALYFHTTDGKDGYEVLFHNGAIDGTCKSGSLTAVRNLYRSLAEDGEWFQFEVAVRDKNISVRINDTDVVCYTEPDQPYRTEAFARRLLGDGEILLKGQKGTMQIRHLTVNPLGDDVTNPNDTLPAVNEQQDVIIRLQQQNFPVIDYHVHLKGGLTKEMAHAMSMNYGINYGVAPNAGEGGVGRMLANDEEVYAYYDEVKPLPFLCGVQGEGRKWTATFSQEALGIFDYLFTDAMTIMDHKGRNSRIYRAEEVHYDGVTKEQYMDQIVDQTVKILTNEPADIFANPTYIPEDMQADYDTYWTDARINRVLDVLQEYQIALEINPRYKIPSLKIIRMAKERGLKFTFGTNNVDANFGRLEYCIEAIEQCGITADDIWFPSMSIRRTRPVVIYNHFPELEKK
ncbi:MAG: family 16 glycoside hydrolase [Parabacteroides sp.]